MQSEEALNLSCVVLTYHGLSHSEFIPVIQSGHEHQPSMSPKSYRLHKSVNTIEAVTANSHRIQEKHNAHEHKTAVTAQLSNAMEHRTGLGVHSGGCFRPGQQLCEPSVIRKECHTALL